MEIVIQICFIDSKFSYRSGKHSKETKIEKHEHKSEHKREHKHEAAKRRQCEYTNI